MNKRSEGRSGPQSLRRGVPARCAQFGRAIPWVLAIALAAAGGTAYWLWKSRTPDARGSAAAQTAGQPGGGPGRQRVGGAKGAQPVSVQAVRRQDIRVTVNAIGSIAALNTAIVHAQVSGVLQRLNFKEGQQVKAGESLAQRKRNTLTTPLSAGQRSPNTLLKVEWRIPWLT